MPIQNMTSCVGIDRIKGAEFIGNKQTNISTHIQILSFIMLVIRLCPQFNIIDADHRSLCWKMFSRRRRHSTLYIDYPFCLKCINQLIDINRFSKDDGLWRRRQRQQPTSTKHCRDVENSLDVRSWCHVSRGFISTWHAAITQRS